MTVYGSPNKYLSKDNIPEYPRPEFWVSQLRHDTDEAGLFNIAVEYQGFCAGEREEGPEQPEDLDLLWWSLSVGDSEIDLAEQRLLQASYPDRTEEQAREQKPFLKRFATSPAFLNTSRLGSYRFIYSLEELLQEYRKQDNDDGVCAYRDGQIIWRPEAMCKTHSFKLVRKPYENQYVAHLIPDPTQHQFYLWDNVAVAFHMADSMTMDFDMYILRNHLRFCEPGETILSPNCEFTSYEDASEMVDCYWPY
ncbi:hypothetical protein DPEC_G00141660 [Dallia pectoralis]|uniref:Uncharacterized protein n=1 Tax=Dallia pectoralis TaxID=75939 RepID=A0ACC2GN98_DALPE|nr:hypothetical protein DPEC_G00141660 [Dallia pectoralis]